jgi:exopolysaccharide/PEP-CTERM locus tyrosine autokinase
MSKIEEAMEKAKFSREREVAPGHGREPKRKSKPLPRQIPSVEIKITNPLLLAANYDNLPIAEEYRKLKSIILHATKKEGFHNTLMVTSSISDEGKSVTALNLAISIAHEHNHTVLLVEADMRQPSICRYLGIEANSGLANCLMDGMDVGDALIKTGLGNLTLLPAGKQIANPVELFSSQKMRDLLDEIKHRYDDRYIIFDTPPLLPFAETRLLGNIVDGVVYVIKEGGTSLQNITEALGYLKDTKVLGIVYNEATVASLSDGYHHYYDSYKYKSQGAELPASKKSQKSGFLARFRKAKLNS